MVDPRDGRPLRRALSSIYFLLPAAERSRWHRVLSDEIWTHLEGDPLTLLTFEGEVRSTTLGPLVRGYDPMHVVQAGVWQAAEVEHGYALVACFVAPGFEFDDFAIGDGPL